MAKSNRGLVSSGGKAMSSGKMTQRGPGGKNVVSGGRPRPGPSATINSKMGSGKMRGGGANGC